MPNLKKSLNALSKAELSADDLNVIKELLTKHEIPFDEKDTSDGAGDVGNDDHEEEEEENTSPIIENKVDESTPPDDTVPVDPVVPPIDAVDATAQQPPDALDDDDPDSPTTTPTTTPTDPVVVDPFIEIRETVQSLKNEIESLKSTIEGLALQVPITEDDANGIEGADDLGQKAKGSSANVPETNVKAELIKKLGGYAR